MPFFLKPEAGSAVSDLLEERLKRLQHQLDDSQKACEGLTAEVVGFARAAREMCRKAGSAAGAFGAALDIEHARLDETKPEKIAATGNGSRRASGAPRSSTEPLRSELLAMQLNECASEMEEDLRVQVLDPMERMLAARKEIQIALKERARAAHNLEAAHKDYARAVARYEPSAAVSGKGDRGKGPTAEMVQLGDRVVQASDAFSEAHGRAEEASSGLLKERGRSLQDAMAALKAAQTVFFVRAGHCVSSSVGQTPPPTTDPEAAKDPPIFLSAAPSWNTADLAQKWPVEKISTTVQEATTIVPEDSSDTPKSDGIETAVPTPVTPAADGDADQVLNVAINPEVSEIPREASATEAPSTPPNLYVFGTSATAEPEGPAPTEEGDTRALRIGLPTASSHTLENPVAVAGSGFSLESFGSGSDIDGSKSQGKSSKNGGRSGPGVTQSETKRRRPTGWLKRLSMTFKISHSRTRSRSSSGGDWAGLEPFSSSADVEDGERTQESFSNAEERLATSAMDSPVAASDIRAVDAISSADLSTEDGEAGGEAGSTATPVLTDEVPEGNAGGEQAANVGTTEDSVTPGDNEKRRRIYESLFGDFSSQSRWHVEPEHCEDLAAGEANASHPDLNITTLQAGVDNIGVLEPPDADDATEGSEGSDSDETGSNTTEGFGSDAAGDLFDRGVGSESVLFPCSPLPRSPIVESAGDVFGRTAGDAESTVGGSCGGVHAVSSRQLADVGENEGDGERQACIDSPARDAAPLSQLGNSADGVNPALAAEPSRDSPSRSDLQAKHDNEQNDSINLTVSDADSESNRSRDSKIVSPSAPPLQSLRASARFVRPPALAPVLLSTPEQTVVSSPRLASANASPRPVSAGVSRPTLSESMPPPSDDPTFGPLLTDVSPVRSESSGRESPRASWRLSGWWARASDRHQPPPPGAEDSDPAAGSSLAATLAVATAGGDAVAAAFSGSGGLTPAFAGNGGDGRPAIADVLSESLSETAGAKDGNDSAVMTASASEIAAAATEEAVAAAVAAERREWIESRRKRLNKSWLAAERLVDGQARPFEAAKEFLDVTELSLANGVCRAWRKRLGGESGTREWRRCVRLADGVPEAWRARFYLHVLYDQPSWLPKAHKRRPIDRPHPCVYQECLLQAEVDDEARKAAAVAADSRDSSAWEDGDQVGESTNLSDGEIDGSIPSPPPLLKCYKWLEEIETDVLRTCPADTETPSGSTRKKNSENVASEAEANVVGRCGDLGTMDAGTGMSTKAIAEEQPKEFPAFSTGDGKGDNRAGESAGGEEALSGSNASDTAGGAEVRWSGTGTGGGTRDKLRRVLRAFAVHNRRVSYCQGMNFVALALLDACSGDDEQAFWILSGMCERLELEGLWCQGLERLDYCFFVLDRLLERHCPSLRQHLADEGVQLSMFTSRWFVTLFACNDVFGRGTSRKIMDIFLVEKWPLIFKVSLGVLLEMRPLLEPADMEGILKVTKFPRAQLFGLRRDGTGRRVAGASFEEAAQGSLCESIRAGQMVDHALVLRVTEETLEEYLREYHQQGEELTPGSD